MHSGFSMYNIFDAHCDTAWELYKDCAKGNFRENILHFSLKETIEYNKYIQLFAFWARPEYDKEEAVSFMNRFIDSTLLKLEREQIDIIKNADDFEFDMGFKAVLGIEGGRSIYNDIDNINRYYEKGIRCFTLSWNGETPLCCGSDVCDDRGLTPLGREAVKRLNELNIVIDVSHLNIQGFYDVLSLTDRPVIASHSNSYSICPHKRNLSDEAFKLLVEKGGVAGINYYPVFLDESGRATIDDMIRHIDRFMELGGENSVGLGSDFDGIKVLPEEIQSASDNYKLLGRLAERGYSREQVDKISYGNFERVFKECLG